MIFTFYKARGMSVGSSLVEEDKLDLAKKLEAAAKEKGVEFILPTDIIAADKFDENAETQVVAAGDIPDGWMVSPSCLSFSSGQEAVPKTVLGKGMGNPSTVCWALAECIETLIVDVDLITLSFLLISVFWQQQNAIPVANSEGTRQ